MSSAVPVPLARDRDPRQDADDRPVRVIRPAAFSARRLIESLRILPRYADLLWVLTRHRINVRYKQSALGPLWAILQPLAAMLVFATVFSLIGRVSTGTRPYAVFAYSGLLAWTAFASALGSAAVSLVSHASLVTRVYFPREILPLTYVAAALFDLMVASSVLGLMLVYYSIPLTPAVLWALPVLAVLAAFAFAVSLLLCAIHIRFRDVGVAMPLLLQVWMFASPVIYPIEAVPDRWRGWYLLNPMAGLVDGFRRAVLDGLPPDPSALGASIAVTAILLPLAYAWFKHVEATMADLV